MILDRKYPMLQKPKITKHDFLKEMREALLRKMILKMKKKEELVDKKSTVLIRGESICRGPVARGWLARKKDLEEVCVAGVDSV